MAHFRPFTVIFTVTNKVHNQNVYYRVTTRITYTGHYTHVNLLTLLAMQSLGMQSTHAAPETSHIFFSDVMVISDHNYITRHLNLKIYTYNTLAWSLSHLGQLHTSICVKLTLQKVPTQEMSEDSYTCISYLPYINYDFVIRQCQ